MISYPPSIEHIKNTRLRELEARLERVRAIPKKSMGSYQIEYEEGWIDGWNDCLDDVQKTLEKGE